jgi:hypothetical protein
VNQFLSEHRKAVGKAWLDRTLALYSAEYGQFVRNNPDPFANPVGAILKEGIDGLLAALFEEADTERCRAALLPVVRLRAVQEAPPSQALAFVPLLKDVVRETLQDKGRGEEMGGALPAFDGRVDRLTLLAFDVYSECRERIFELRVNELKRSTARLLRPRGRRDEDDGGPQCRSACDSDKGCCP